MYNRYAIGAESELAATGATLSDYLRRSGWHSVGTPARKPSKSEGNLGGGGKESNLPASAIPAKPVLKTGGATGPLPPPSLIF